MSVLILVVDDEPDVASLFQQQFRRELRSGRFLMKFASSAAEALERIAVPEDASLILVFSVINMPGRIGLELLPKIQAAHPEVPSPSTAASELNGSPALPVRPVVHRLCWCSRDDSGPTRRSGPRLSRPAIVAWRSRRGGEIAVPIS